MSDVLTSLDTGPRFTQLPVLARKLLDRLEDLTDRLVGELVSDDEQYRRGDLVPRDDLWRSCHDNLQQVIEYLVAPPDDLEEAFAPPADTGRRRAEQGFPLENLLHAYRVGGRLIWQGLLEEARQLDELEATAELLEGATQVWDVIDAFSSVVGESYRTRRAELRRHSEEHRLMLIDGLLEGRAREVAFAREAATILDLPERGPYTVVVLRGTTDAAARPPMTMLPALWRQRASSQVAIVPLEDLSIDQVMAVLDERVTGAVGLSPAVDDLSELDQAHQWAETAAATATPHSGVALLDERLPAALLVSEPQLTRRLRARLEDSLAAIDEADRERLVETIDAYLEADLSVRLAAERLHCHRNTVRNRLHEFEEVTGWSLKDVDRLVELSLARTAARVSTTSTEAPA